MNLNVILPIKKIVINEKTISIPKLGLKHHNLMKDVKGPDENMNLLLDSICPGLTAAESDIVVLHLLAFNNRIKETVVKDDFTYDLNKVYICQRLTKDAVQSTTTRYKELEKLSPEVAKDLKVELDQLQKLLDSKISEPAPTAEAIPAAEQPEVKQSASIKAAADSREAARTRESNTQSQPIQVNTAVNKNSTYVYRTPPQTSTAAPGMQGAMKTS